MTSSAVCFFNIFGYFIERRWCGIEKFPPGPFFRNTARSCACLTARMQLCFSSCFISAPCALNILRVPPFLSSAVFSCKKSFFFTAAIFQAATDSWKNDLKSIFPQRGESDSPGPDKEMSLTQQYFKWITWICELRIRFLKICKRDKRRQHCQCEHACFEVRALTDSPSGRLGIPRQVFCFYWVLHVSRRNKEISEILECVYIEMTWPSRNVSLQIVVDATFPRRHSLSSLVLSHNQVKWCFINLLTCQNIYPSTRLLNQWAKWRAIKEIMREAY